MEMGGEILENLQLGRPSAIGYQKASGKVITCSKSTIPIFTW